MGGNNLKDLVEKQYHELDGVKIEVKYAHPGGIPGGPQNYQHWNEQQLWTQKEISKPHITCKNWLHQSYQSQSYNQLPYNQIVQNFTQQKYFTRHCYRYGKNIATYNYGKNQNIIPRS